MKTTLLLIALLLLPWTPWAEKEPGWIVDAHTQPIDCPKVFRVEKCGRYLDSAFVQYYDIGQDTAATYHWEYFIKIKRCTTQVLDTTVYVGER